MASAFFALYFHATRVLAIQSTIKNLPYPGRTLVLFERACEFRISYWLHDFRNRMRHERETRSTAHYGRFFLKIKAKTTWVLQIVFAPESMAYSLRSSPRATLSFRSPLVGTFRPTAASRRLLRMAVRTLAPRTNTIQVLRAGRSKRN